MQRVHSHQITVCWSHQSITEGKLDPQTTYTADRDAKKVDAKMLSDVEAHFQHLSSGWAHRGTPKLKAGASPNGYFCWGKMVTKIAALLSNNLIFYMRYHNDSV